MWRIAMQGKSEILIFLSNPTEAEARWHIKHVKVRSFSEEEEKGLLLSSRNISLKLTERGEA
jgi:hypothetical protein